MMELLGPGTYVLLIEPLASAAGTGLRIGRLGCLRLQPGCYLYVGSALGGLRARLARHLRREKRVHWHVDYLLAAAAVPELWVAAGPARRECAWARALAAAGLAAPLPNLCASDCACRSHLFYSPTRPSPALLADATGDLLQVLTPTALATDGR